MSTYRKRPVEVEATQWFRNGDHPDDGPADSEGEVVRYFRRPEPEYGGKLVHDKCSRTWHDHGWIDTLEGGHTVCPGDWIIRGVRDERYPCKPDIFDATYEPVYGPLTDVDPDAPPAAGTTAAAEAGAERMGRALTDSVADVPALMTEVRRLRTDRPQIAQLWVRAEAAEARVERLLGDLDHATEQATTWRQRAQALEGGSAHQALQGDKSVANRGKASHTAQLDSHRRQLAEATQRWYEEQQQTTAAVTRAEAAEAGVERLHDALKTSAAIEVDIYGALIAALGLDNDDADGCLPGCDQDAGGATHMIWHLVQQRDEARAEMETAEYRRSLAAASLTDRAARDRQVAAAAVDEAADALWIHIFHHGGGPVELVDRMHSRAARIESGDMDLPEVDSDGE